MSDKTTFVSFLLDETGSMEPIAADTVGGFNTYVRTLQEGDADILFSLVTFNSNETSRRYVAEPIDAVKPLDGDEYRPEAMTPLIDAAVKIINATSEAVAHRGDDPNVVIVMQTDGLENVSVEYTHRDLAALIKEKKAAGWEFVFLGAGLDAFAAARKAGIHVGADQVLSYGRRSTRAAFMASAKNVQDYAESDGDPMALSFSHEQRLHSEDVHTGQYLDAGGAGTRPSRSGRKGSGRKSKSRGSGARGTVEDIDLSRK